MKLTDKDQNVIITVPKSHRVSSEIS